MNIIKKIITCCLICFSIVYFCCLNYTCVLGATASNKTGYCTIIITGDGYTTKRQIKITLSGTDLSKAQTFTLSEVPINRIF